MVTEVSRSLSRYLVALVLSRFIGGKMLLHRKQSALIDLKCTYFFRLRLLLPNFSKLINCNKPIRILFDSFESSFKNKTKSYD